MHLPKAFWYKNGVTVRGSNHIIPLSQLVIGALYPFFNIPSPEMTDLVVGNGACPFANVTAFDLSVYPNLETLTIGNYSFRYASLELKSILSLSE